MTGKRAKGKQVTRYVHKDANDPRTPETGHTPLLPGEEQVVTLDMDNGWSQGLEVAKLEDGRTVLVDMDPAVDPVLMWAGKRNRREIPVLPLQRNEVVSESRIAQIIERARRSAESGADRQGSLFSDLEKKLRESEKDKRVEFYTHEEEWKNKLICGDSLPVMESLIKYEGLAGKVQAIYMDPPYGIAYDSNFQQRVDTWKNDGKDSADDVLTIRAFRDTWSLGIHSYLQYLAERLFLCRELLHSSGSIFVQTNDDNVHLVRTIMDEVFGRSNFISQITFRKKLMPLGAKTLESMADFVVWYAKDKDRLKYNQLYRKVSPDPRSRWTGVELPDGTRRRLNAEERRSLRALPKGARVYRTVSQLAPSFSDTNVYEFEFEGRTYVPPAGQCWVTSKEKMELLAAQGRIEVEKSIPYYVMYHDDFPYQKLTNPWFDTAPAQSKQYAVQTSEKVVARCILMATDSGDLVLDPTLGSGTTAVVAEEYGRRWIGCDVGRVSVNIARQRLLGRLFDGYRLRGESPASGFQLQSVQRTSLKSIANDLEPKTIELVDRPL